MVELLTKKRVAQLLNVSTRTVDRIRASGELKAARIQGSVRFRPEEVEQYIAKVSRS